MRSQRESDAQLRQATHELVSLSSDATADDAADVARRATTARAALERLREDAAASDERAQLAALRSDATVCRRQALPIALFAV